MPANAFHQMLLIKYQADFCSISELQRKPEMAQRDGNLVQKNHKKRVH